jgi:hypothetical protein
MRIVLCVEYDGAGFCGFQSQAGGCGVQDALESAIHQDSESFDTIEIVPPVVENISPLSGTIFS